MHARVIAQAVDLRSWGWMLSCQRLIPSAFHRFFFFLEDLISIPTQSFRILSSFLLCLPSSSSCSTDLYLFWSKQDWCKLQQRGRCHSQTVEWWRGSLLCSSTPFLHFSPLIIGKFQPSQPCYFHARHVQMLYLSVCGIQEKEGRIASLSWVSPLCPFCAFLDSPPLFSAACQVREYLGL